MGSLPSNQNASPAFAPQGSDVVADLVYIYGRGSPQLDLYGHFVGHTHRRSVLDYHIHLPLGQRQLSQDL